MRTTKTVVIIDSAGATIALPKRQYKLLKKYLHKPDDIKTFNIFVNVFGESSKEITFLPLPTKKESLKLSR